jgi:hypothetical protein
LAKTLHIASHSPLNDESSRSWVASNNSQSPPASTIWRKSMLRISTQKMFAAIAPAFVALSLMPLATIAQPSIDINQPVSPVKPIKMAMATVSGKIINAGSNNGGQPNFNCNQIKIYPAVAVNKAPSNPDEIVMTQYKQIGGLATVSGGSAAAGCTYKLTLTGKALNQPIHLIATAPKAWTTSVDTVDVVPKYWANPWTFKAGQNLKGDFQIRATLVK